VAVVVLEVVAGGPPSVEEVAQEAVAEADLAQCPQASAADLVEARPASPAYPRPHHRPLCLASEARA